MFYAMLLSMVLLYIHFCIFLRALQVTVDKAVNGMEICIASFLLTDMPLPRLQARLLRCHLVASGTMGICISET